MQVCFIIDNSPLTKQTYSQSTSINNLHASLTVLDTIKIGIETSLNDLSRSATYIWDFPVFHLFVTSKPNQPLSSFQHDKLHFNYQLKEIKSADTLTFPLETIKFALKHVSKFRMMSEAETVLGYRKYSVYEPVLIFFFSYGITSRTLAKLQSRRLEKSMRSQYKFIHMRICYPSQNQKQKNFLKNKAEVQNSTEALRWAAFAEKMNKGWHRNVFKYQGKQSLSDLMTKCFVSYKPSLCSEFNFQFDIKMMFPEYFKSSQLNLGNLMGNEQENKFKVQLLKINESYSNYIPVPFESTFSNIGNGTHEIEEVEPLQFYVDLSRKLNGNISNMLPFINYGFISNPPRFTKLEKQLQRLGINQILFPLYVKISQGIHQKQKSYYLCGFLHFACDPKLGNLFQLMITYPNFPYIQWVLNYVSSPKYYSDTRQVEKLLIDYHSGIPDFYYRFLSEFFNFVAARIPAMGIYETVAANNWNKHLAATGQAKNSIEEVQIKIRKAVSAEYAAMIRLKKENQDAHIEGRAQCCPIYSKIQDYITYSKSISIALNQNKSSSNSLSKLLEKVFAFNQKNGVNSYFSSKQDEKLGPMTRELNKYMQKAFANEGNGNGLQMTEFSIAQANERIDNKAGFEINVANGLFPKKRVKQSFQDKQKQPTITPQKKINDDNIDLDAQSVFPARQGDSQLESEDFVSEQRKNEQELEPLPLMNRNLDYLMPNSVSIDTMKKNPENAELADKIIETERCLLLNKMNAEKDVQSLITNEQMSDQLDPRLARRQIEGLNKNSLMKKQTHSERLRNTPGALNYVNRIKEQNSRGMKLNISKLKTDKFEQNLIKLESIGFISLASTFLLKGT